MALGSVSGDVTLLVRYAGVSLEIWLGLAWRDRLSLQRIISKVEFNRVRMNIPSSDPVVDPKGVDGNILYSYQRAWVEFPICTLQAHSPLPPPLPSRHRRSGPALLRSLYSSGSGFLMKPNSSATPVLCGCWSAVRGGAGARRGGKRRGSQARVEGQARVRRTQAPSR